MKDFEKYFSGLQRDYGFCNVENGYIDPESGKLKFDPGGGGKYSRLRRKVINRGHVWFPKYESVKKIFDL